MALKLDILANTRQLESEMKSAAREVEGVSDELDNVGKAGTDAGKKISKGLDGAKGGLNDFKQEGKQTSAEVAASFDGSAESIAGGFQELAANAFSGFGPAGAAIGAAIALGMGGAIEMLDGLKTISDETREAIIADFVEVGDALEREAVDARVLSLMSAEPTRKQAELLKEILGVNLAQAYLILAGDAQSAGTTMEEAIAGVQGAASDVDWKTFQELKTTMEATNGAFATGTELAKAREEASRATGETERAQTQKTKEADQLRWEAYARAKTNATGDVTQRVYLQVDDYNVRTYVPPTIVAKVRLQTPTGVMGWQ
jgi:hypothetical protein